MLSKRPAGQGPARARFTYFLVFGWWRVCLIHPNGKPDFLFCWFLAGKIPRPPPTPPPFVLRRAIAAILECSSAVVDDHAWPGKTRPCRLHFCPAEGGSLGSFSWKRMEYARCKNQGIPLPFLGFFFLFLYWPAPRWGRLEPRCADSTQTREPRRGAGN